jgi:hypothetical protein
MTAYIGFDIDPQSQWLLHNLGGELLRNAHRYVTFEELMISTRPSLKERVGTFFRLRRCKSYPKSTAKHSS